MQQLTQDQVNAINALSDLYVNKHPFLEISGSAGTGKSTLLRYFIHRHLKTLEDGLKLIHEKPRQIILTATTNKAAQALHQATGCEVKTIHSVLGIRLLNGKLVYPAVYPRTDTVFVIDEFSYIDSELLSYIKKIRGKGTSFVFIGDPCQLTPVNQQGIPVVAEQYPAVYLHELVRQETSVLKDIGEQLKAFVRGGPFPDLVPDDTSFIYYDGSNAENDFIDAMIKAFNRGSAKFISYTNKRVEEINKFMLEEIHNRNKFEAGDMAINNSHVSTGHMTLKVDQVVFIESEMPDTMTISVKGKKNTFKGQKVKVHGRWLFVPDSYKDFKAIKSINAKSLSNGRDYDRIMSTADLRTEYACTVHKSQGSSYDEVFIDLTDFKSIKSDETLARLLYVALTRTKKKLHIIGDL